MGVRAARRQKLAAAIVAGKTVTQAAAEAGISRAWASRELRQPETRLEIAALLEAHRERIHALVARSLDVIAEALKADRVALDRDGAAVNLGADHYARLQAVKRLVELCAAAQPVERYEQRTSGGLTLEELRAMVLRYRRAGGGA